MLQAQPSGERMAADQFAFVGAGLVGMNLLLTVGASGRNLQAGGKGFKAVFSRLGELAARFD
jgi:hypothetical protein